MMQTYYHIGADGYVRATTTGDVAPDPLLGCTVVEAGSTPIDGDFWHPYRQFHWGRKQWEDRRTLNQRKLLKWAEIKAERDQRELSTLTWNGYEFDADATSQARIQIAFQQAMLAASASQSFSVEWTLADNSVISLTGAEVIHLAKGLFNRTLQLHQTARGLRADILAAQNAAAVEAIQWP
jgi:hypothetical protein